MFFVTRLGCAPPRASGLVDSVRRHRIPVSAAGVPRDVGVFISLDRPTLAAVYEVSVSPASWSSAPAGPGIATPRATADGLGHGCGPFVDPADPSAARAADAIAMPRA